MDEAIDKQGRPERKSSAWTKSGFYEAVRLILAEKNTLFESLMGKITDFPELSVMLRALLFIISTMYLDEPRYRQKIPKESLKVRRYVL